MLYGHYTVFTAVAVAARRRYVMRRTRAHTDHTCAAPRALLHGRHGASEYVPYTRPVLAPPIADLPTRSLALVAEGRYGNRHSLSRPRRARRHYLRLADTGTRTASSQSMRLHSMAEGRLAPDIRNSV